MTLQQFLELEYSALLQAQAKITGNHELGLDLLHYAIEEMSHKDNLQAILDSGGGRFYLVRIMMVQWRSQTGPFYRQFVKSNDELNAFEPADEAPEPLDIDRVNAILDGLPWYDKNLFLLYTEKGLNYSELARETQIPRTSIGLTVNRVRKHIKKNL